MKTYYYLYILVASVIFCNLWEMGNARGGRGRGGGSFGGLFGNFRKYKKLSSTGSGRRTVNGSPMQPLAVKPVKPLSPTHAKPPPSYPKQAPPPSYTSSVGGSYHNYYGGPGGATHLPPGGSYYANTATMPTGAIYYGQPPMRSSSGTGDFLFGMMAGHVLARAMSGPRVNHVTHIHRQEDPSDEGPKVIIINNNETNKTAVDSSTGTTNLSTDSDVMLTELNSTIIPSLPLETANASAVPTASMATEEPAAFQLPPGGIICVPVLLNVTDPNDESQQLQQVEKVLCYPAPPPPALEKAYSTNCAEPANLDDRGEPSKQSRDCWDLWHGNKLSTAEPPQIAGEIAIESGEQQKFN